MTRAHDADPMLLPDLQGELTIEDGEREGASVTVTPDLIDLYRAAYRTFADSLDVAARARGATLIRLDADRDVLDQLGAVLAGGERVAMILGQFGLPLTIAGALVLAGIVYALQRLRAQPRVLRLPTAGLWAQAMRAAPVRVLGGRFRYWLAYLLILPSHCFCGSPRRTRNWHSLTGTGPNVSTSTTARFCRGRRSDRGETCAARRRACDAGGAARGLCRRCAAVGRGGKRIAAVAPARRAGRERPAVAFFRLAGAAGCRRRCALLRGMACRARRDTQPKCAIWLSRRSGAGQSRHRRPGRDAGGIGRLVESRCNRCACRRGTGVRRLRRICAGRSMARHSSPTGSRRWVGGVTCCAISLRPEVSWA